MPDSRLTAVIWDFDNTLADTRHRNLNVTRRIVARVTGRDYTDFPPLHSVEKYDAALHRTDNWQELYLREFGLDAEAIAFAGSLWTEYQLADDTPVSFYSGVAFALEALAHLPHGIVSLNSRRNIREMLGGVGLFESFHHVVGYEEVPYHRQKPEPDGLLLCLEQLTAFAPGHVLYVGDHRTDALCAAQANDRLRERGVQIRVTAVFAAYGSTMDEADWPVPPDHRATTPREVVEIAARLDSGTATE